MLSQFILHYVTLSYGRLLELTKPHANILRKLLLSHLHRFESLFYLRWGFFLECAYLPLNISLEIYEIHL